MKKTLLAMVLTANSTGMAYANQKTAEVPPLYVSIQTGYASQGATTSDNYSLSGSSFAGAINLGYNYKLTTGALMRVALSYTYKSPYEDTISGTSVKTNIGVNDMAYNIYYDFPTNSQFTPYIGIGAGYRTSSYNVKNESTHYSTSVPSLSSWIYTGALGLTYDIHPNWVADVSIQYVRSTEAISGSYWYLDNMNSIDVLIGIRYNFYL